MSILVIVPLNIERHKIEEWFGERSDEVVLLLDSTWNDAEEDCNIKNRFKHVEFIKDYNSLFLEV